MITAETGVGAQAPLHPVQFRNEWNPAQIDDAVDHIRLSSFLDLPELPLVPPHNGRCIIAGSAPSLVDHVETIREMYKEDGALLFGVNYSYGHLCGKGIVPNAYLCFEVGPDVRVDALKPMPETTYYISSMAHPRQFKHLEGYKRVVWHVWSPLEKHKAVMDECYPGAMLVCGGSSTALRAINVGFALGYRRFDMFGFDCSFSEGVTRIPESVEIKQDWCEIVARSTTGEQRVFASQPYLVRQAEDFREICRNFGHLMSIKVHGEGLAPFIHRQMFPHEYQEQ